MNEPGTSGAGNQSATSHSRVNNRQASYQNVGAVYNGPVINQKIVKDNSVVYEVGHDDVRGMERFSMWIMENLGEFRAKVATAVSALLGGGGILSLTSPSIHLPPALSTPTLLASIALIMAASALIAALKFKADSRCTNCNRFYAMQERGEPTVRETPRKGGVQRTVKRHYQCRYCKDEISSTKSEFIEDQPEEED